MPVILRTPHSTDQIAHKAMHRHRVVRGTDGGQGGCEAGADSRNVGRILTGNWYGYRNPGCGRCRGTTKAGVHDKEGYVASENNLVAVVEDSAAGRAPGKVGGSPATDNCGAVVPWDEVSTAVHGAATNPNCRRSSRWYLLTMG